MNNEVRSNVCVSSSLIKEEKCIFSYVELFTQRLFAFAQN